MIGGTSWFSTLEYYKLINTHVNRLAGTKSNPELILYSINVEIMRRQERDEINEKYLEVSNILKNAGAEGIIICANTPHMTYDYIQPKIDIPILHIADAIGREAQRLGLSNLGLLGTMPTMKSGFIVDKLKNDFNIDTLIPAEDDLQKTHDYIADELTQGVFSYDAKEFYLSVMDRLASNGADGIILGCTELPILLKEVSHRLPYLSTTQLHVDYAVEFIMQGVN